MKSMKENFSQLLNFKKEIATAIAPLIKPNPILSEINEIPSEYCESASQWVKTLNLNKIEYTGKNTVVAILDSGIYDEHPDLFDNELKCKKVIHQTFYKIPITDSADKELGIGELLKDEYGHGTHVAGIIAANESNILKGFRGIAPDAKIVSVKVTDGSNESTSWVNIAKGIERVLEYNNDPKVEQEKKVTCILICFSGFDNFNSKESSHMKQDLIAQFRKCFDQDIPVIVPSGNHYLDFCTIKDISTRNAVTGKIKIPKVEIKEDNGLGLAYPGYCDWVISAGATSNIDFDDFEFERRPNEQNASINSRNPIHFQRSFRKGDLSLFSQRIRTHLEANYETRSFNEIPPPYFLCAPGIYTVSTDNTYPQEGRLVDGLPSGYSELSGSCQAAAVVAGTILLLQEALRAKKFPNEIVSIKRIIQHLMNGAESINYDEEGCETNNANEFKFLKVDISKSINLIL